MTTLRRSDVHDSELIHVTLKLTRPLHMDFFFKCRNGNTTMQDVLEELVVAFTKPEGSHTSRTGTSDLNEGE